MSVESLSGSYDPNEPPLFELDAMHEPDHPGEMHSPGMAVHVEGVTIPADAVRFGNGKLPEEFLHPIEIGHHRLHATAAAAFLRLRAAAAESGIDLTCSDSYRSLEVQIELKQQKPAWSATPGRSAHGWGFAVDLSIGSPPKPFGMSVLNWLKANGPALGWYMGRPKDEPWHWVYRGPGSPGQPTQIETPASTGRPTTPTPVDDGDNDEPISDPAITGNAEVTLHSSGLAVQILRDLLGMPPGDVFDQATTDAVLAFQKANALKDDGKVGPKTWAMLRKVTAPIDPPELKKGSTGDAVKWLQRRLGCTVDGSFGKQTQAAVQAFQRAKGLAADGRVGKITFAALTT